MLDRQAIDLLFMEHLIARAERTLADHKRIGSLLEGTKELLEMLIADMYENRRIAMEAMIQAPFVSGLCDAR